jgi:hypothetical protein
MFKENLLGGRRILVTGVPDNVKGGPWVAPFFN